MPLIAHATQYEIATAILIFLAGACAGQWLVHIIARRLKARRD
jgi:hypothetical protein